MITANPRPMSAAPLDGTPVRLFVSGGSAIASFWSEERCQKTFGAGDYRAGWYLLSAPPANAGLARSEEHTSELQSRENLVCRLLLEKKKKSQSSKFLWYKQTDKIHTK